jgi:hypothetical protein
LKQGGESEPLIKKMASLKIYSRKGKTSSNERLAPLDRWAEGRCLETISRVLNGLGSQPSQHKRDDRFGN